MKKIDKNDDEIIDWVFFMKKHVTISEEKSSSERALVFGARVELSSYIIATKRRARPKAAR